MEAGPDAIQLGLGQARLLQKVAGRKPALVLRGDVANVYGPNLPAQLFCMTLGNAVEQAVRADAAALVLNLFHAPGQTELYRQCLANIAAVKPECERYGMPLMVEPLSSSRGRAAATKARGLRCDRGTGAAGGGTGRRPDQERSARRTPPSFIASSKQRAASRCWRAAAAG